MNIVHNCIINVLGNLIKKYYFSTKYDLATFTWHALIRFPYLFTGDLFCIGFAALLQRDNCLKQ